MREYQTLIGAMFIAAAIPVQPVLAAAEGEGRARLGFQTRMAALVREGGTAALKGAKANHDRLEAVYNPYVDFDGVRTLAALEAGRLLSWLG